MGSLHNLTFHVAIMRISCFDTLQINFPYFKVQDTHHLKIDQAYFKDYYYLSKVPDDIGDTAEVRTDLDLVLNVAIILLEDPFQEASNFPCFLLLLLLLLSLKLCKAKVDDSVQSSGREFWQIVQMILQKCLVCSSMNLVIDVIVQSASVAL